MGFYAGMVGQARIQLLRLRHKECEFFRYHERRFRRGRSSGEYQSEYSSCTARREFPRPIWTRLVRPMNFRRPQRSTFRSPAGAALNLPAAVLALSFSSPAAAQGNVSKAEADAKNFAIAKSATASQPRVPRLLPDPAACRTTDRIPEESIASVRRASTPTSNTSCSTLGTC